MPQRERTLHHLRLCIAEAARRHTPAEIARAEALLETAGAGLSQSPLTRFTGRGPLRTSAGPAADCPAGGRRQH